MQARATRMVIRRCPDLVDRLILLDMLGLLPDEYLLDPRVLRVLPH